MAHRRGLIEQTEELLRMRLGNRSWLVSGAAVIVGIGGMVTLALCMTGGAPATTRCATHEAGALFCSSRWLFALEIVNGTDRRKAWTLAIDPQCRSDVPL
ncbi:hypothetical protein ISP15_01500 [Dyella jejuensis]|uniref:Uncharacterized protein n=1 Tax=Dyella jejuensis TaxID=1432009 RepID=A0ABW8JD49_9GAMM